MDQEFETLSNVEFTGYEIHMGESRRKDGATASTFTCDSVTGTEKTEGTFRKNVCGTYVHGIFDKEDVAMGLVRAVGEKKASMSLIWTGVDFATFKETQYNILASELRKHLDMKRIYEILEEGNRDRKRGAQRMKVELENVKPMEIEKRSFEIITEELGDTQLVPGTELIVKRCIHTSADFDYADNLCFSDGVVQRAHEAIKAGACICDRYTDGESGDQ